MLDAEQVKAQAIALGFHKVGIAAIEPAPSEAEHQAKAALNSWLAQGFHADMDWMKSPRRQDIRHIMPEAKSMICVALNYYTDVQRPEGEQYAKISRYGWGRDYHRILTKKLKQFSAWLRLQSTSEGSSHSQESQTPIEARPYADTGPVQDKFWAQQAGIGWNAKNGNVITRQYGSWVFLGEIITTAVLTPDTPHTAHCGSCTRCLDACPTAAIREPGVVDANRCIAYHTIENRADTLPNQISNNLKNWVAGCDICQDVCPWNQRFAKPTDVEGFEPYENNVGPTLSELADITDEEWNARFPASALRRIKPYMLRRNAKAALTKSPVQNPIKNVRPKKPYTN
ncbi:MAG: tRNA epoxyqueuosine(34) reductase QueG [Cyanobacteria bacterium P01_F01_bin.3]